MVTITIDGKQISVDENLSILEAAQEADVKIPTLCYLKDVNEVGACKMCVVEVEGSRHLVTSCNTKVKEGMVVNTHSERVVNSRKQVLNMLLANHDIRCFSCSKSGDCRLQDLSNEYGITKSCYPGSAAKFEAKKENPFLTYYPELCINCQRCVSTCNKVSCNGTLHNSKIGTRTLIDAPFGPDWKETDCESCGNCAAVCPTGALVAKNRKKYQVVQDTLIKVWNARDRWLELDSIEAYSLTIARNLSLDRIKKMENQNDSLEEQNTERLDENTSTPSERMIQKDKLDIVRNIIDELPEKQRSCLQLRDIEGKSYKEIADILCITEDQVKVNIFRARQTVKQRFQQFDRYGL